MDDLIKSVIDDLVKEFANNGGNSYFVIDGQEFRTDTGYAMEGITLFAEKLKERVSKENEPVGCSGCRYDWFGDPRCSKCARSFQDYYEADMIGE